ncbi:hypothetical protein GCM10022198_22540 [Klugiella xanthotipulae]|nr:hypothetical protein [Klugiella xanthotipulae]
MFLIAAHTLMTTALSVASPPALATTGQDIMLMVIIGVIVLGVGAALVIMGRIRRRKETEAAAAAAGAPSAETTITPEGEPTNLGGTGDAPTEILPEPSETAPDSDATPTADNNPSS